MENSNYNKSNISPSYNKPYTPISKDKVEEVKLFMDMIEREREENTTRKNTRSNLSRFLR